MYMCMYIYLDTQCAYSEPLITNYPNSRNLSIALLVFIWIYCYACRITSE